MGKVHHRYVDPGPQHQREARRPKRFVNGGGVDPVRPGAGDEAAVEVEAHQPVIAHQAGAIGRRLAQALNKADRNGIVIVVTELQAGLAQILAGVIEDLGHHRAMLSWRMGNDPGLGKIGDKVMQPVGMGFRQLVADDDQKGEIAVGLGLEAGQGDRLEMSEPLFHARGRVEIGDAVLDAVMLDLETAERRIGKSAQSNDLHYFFSA